MNYVSSETYSLSQAIADDDADELSGFRNQFYIPQHHNSDCIYLTGNSLGLQPKQTEAYIKQELSDWATHGVEAHFRGKHPWYYYHHFCEEVLSELVGARKQEVAAMGSLTNNLHLLLVSFYRPVGRKYKILMEANAFPSDQYAIESQVRFHGYHPDDAIIELAPRPGERFWRTEDILRCIDEHRDELALVLMSGVNYLNGQFFNISEITAQAHQYKILAGFDLAHAIGNIPLQLHDWQADFACWCSYKYLNSGPGGVAGIFVHEKHSNNPSLPRFAGWWGNDESTRFEMKKGFHPQPGAAGWQLSNAPVLHMAAHRASLDLFKQAGINRLRAKSEKMTLVLKQIIDQYNQMATVRLQCITPDAMDERGCQFSLIASERGKEVFDVLTQHGVIADWREPNVIRMAPVPMYNSFMDLYRLKEILFNLAK
ncbi:MAG: kynureninase [Bacteroidota bacterium]|jgi:kynureninase